MYFDIPTFYYLEEKDAIRSVSKCWSTFLFYILDFFYDFFYLFQVCGVENLATADPLNVLNLKDGQYHSEFSYVCRFSLGVAIYISIALGQIILWCGIYNNLIEDKLEQFTDVCSLANISMFAMAQNNFGYYIHGK